MKNRKMKKSHTYCILLLVAFWLPLQLSAQNLINDESFDDTLVFNGVHSINLQKETSRWLYVAVEFGWTRISSDDQNYMGMIAPFNTPKGSAIKGLVQCISDYKATKGLCSLSFNYFMKNPASNEREGANCIVSVYGFNSSKPFAVNLHSRLTEYSQLTQLVTVDLTQFGEKNSWVNHLLDVDMKDGFDFIVVEFSGAAKTGLAGIDEVMFYKKSEATPKAAPSALSIKNTSLEKTPPAEKKSADFNKVESVLLKSDTSREKITTSSPAVKPTNLEEPVDSSELPIGLIAVVGILLAAGVVVGLVVAKKSKKKEASLDGPEGQALSVDPKPSTEKKDKPEETQKETLPKSKKPAPEVERATSKKQDAASNQKPKKTEPIVVEPVSVDPEPVDVIEESVEPSPVDDQVVDVATEPSGSPEPNVEKEKQPLDVEAEPEKSAPIDDDPFSKHLDLLSKLKSKETK